MASDRRLLVLSCSQRKRHTPGLLPAIDRYDGPAFRVLRRFLSERPDGAKQLDVFILSTMYGLIPAQYPIAEYNWVMTSRRANELHNSVLAAFTNLILTGYTHLCLAMSSKYLMALEGWEVQVPSEVTVTVTVGPQGLKLAQLKHWLWHNEAVAHIPKRQMAKPSGMARLRGVELRLTPVQVLESVQTALVDDRTNANRLREWFVELNGHHVAPKWLVSVLTGLPVNTFAASEARRVLCQLGLRVRRITEAADDNQSA